MRKFLQINGVPQKADVIHSWTAICRGAVLKGMSDETVVNHISKYHYGIHFQEKYNSSKHEEQDKVWDMVECEWKAYHQMRWYISRVSIVFEAWVRLFLTLTRAIIFLRLIPSNITGIRPSQIGTN